MQTAHRCGTRFAKLQWIVCVGGPGAGTCAEEGKATRAEGATGAEAAETAGIPIHEMSLEQLHGPQEVWQKPQCGQGPGWKH